MDFTTIKDDKIFLGDTEFRNIAYALIKGYKFHNKNELPKAIVIPILDNVDGVKVEYGEQKTKRGTGKTGMGDSKGDSQGEGQETAQPK